MENIKAITKTAATEIRRVRPNAKAVSVTVDGEIYHATVDGIAYTFECGSDDDQLVFVNDTDETDTIVVPLPESLLDKLNELRASAGMKPLKSWRASNASLEAAIAKLSPPPPPPPVAPRRQREPSRLACLFPGANLKIVRSKLRRKSDKPWQDLDDKEIKALES